MANIAIVNYCNLKCPYCFAEDMIKEDNAFMSLEQYSKLLDFILKDPENRIGILGGEPTLHPQFIELLNLTKEKCKKRQIILFTNGIELKQFLPYIDGIQVLINYNHPNNLSEIQKNKLQQSLNAIEELDWFNVNRISLGCNIYLGCTDYSYFWDAVSKYKLKIVRCSVVAPGGIYTDWKNKKDEYFNLLKPVYLEFCKEAIKHNCILEMDCSHVPFCYFTEEEKELVH